LRHKWHIGVLVLFGLMACAQRQSPYERVAQEQEHRNDEFMASVQESGKARNELLKVCEADTEDYFAHPKRPYLRSCLDFQVEIRKGIDDRQAWNACHEDLMETIESCKRWRKATNEEIERIQTMKRFRSY